MIVMKFGGTSMGSPQRIKSVADIVTGQYNRSDIFSSVSKSKCIVVVSAMAGTTNKLLEISRLLKEHMRDEALNAINHLHEQYVLHCEALCDDEKCKARIRQRTDKIFANLRQYCDEEYITDFEERTIVSFGERLSTKMLTEVLFERGTCVDEWNALDFMRINNRQEVDMDYLRTSLASRLSAASDASIVITQGFICRNAYGEIDNLQRGGSDFTATLIASAIHAQECQIWTDVSGVQTADPRHINNTRTIPHLHFDEAIALAYNGAKVLHPICVEPAKQQNVSIILLNTMEPDHQGTIIDSRHDDTLLKAIAVCHDVVHLKISKSKQHSSDNTLHHLWNVITQYSKSIHHLSSNHDHLSLCVSKGKTCQQLLNILSTYAMKYTQENVALITVVGDGIKHNMKQVMEKIFQSVSVNLMMFNAGTADNAISFAVQTSHSTQVVQQLNDSLFA